MYTSNGSNVYLYMNFEMDYARAEVQDPASGKNEFLTRNI